MFDPSLSSYNPQPEPRPGFFNFKNKSPRAKIMILAGGLVIILLGSFLIGISRHTIVVGQILGSINNQKTHTLPLAVQRDYVMPKKESDRLDVLILGIRGQDDPDAANGGPLLTDSMQVLSYNKKTNTSALISIPRDLYVYVDGDKQDKLNAAYEYGYYHSADSLKFIKEKVSQITGVYIDYVLILDFSSFKQIIDSVGGIDVTLAVPFDEPKEWGFPFHVPAGLNHMDGQTALYYARSRYSSSDFDRSRRQQQIMFALKDKLTSLNFFKDPIKTLDIFNTLRKNIRTDIGIWDVNTFLGLEKNIDFSTIKKYVISTDNLVNEGKTSEGAYILTPKGGNFDVIKKEFQDILITPAPTK